MKSGIYKIINRVNGKFYLGSSEFIKNRWKRHRWELRHNKHHSVHLQRAWNKYGESNFSFEVFLEVKEELLIETEQKMLDDLKPWDESVGYNNSKFASGGDLISYHPNIEEIREKQRNNTKIRWENLSKEEKDQYSDKMKGDGNPNWRGGTCTFTCPICGKKRKGMSKNYKTCRKCRDTTGKNNSFYGKKHLPESLRKMSEYHKSVGNSNNIQKISVEIDGVVYSSFSLAAKSLGCAVASIRNRLNNPSKFPTYKLIQQSEHSS